LKNLTAMEGKSVSARSTSCFLLLVVLLGVQLAAGCPSLSNAAMTHCQDTTVTAVSNPGTPLRDDTVGAPVVPQSRSTDLLKPDASSALLWARTYGAGLDDFAQGVVTCSDGGYAFVGSTRSYGAGGLDVLLVRTDPYGHALWNRTYGGSLDEEGVHIVELADGGFLVAGFTRSFGAGGLDAWLIRTNASGDVLWNSTYGGSLDDAAYEAVPCRSGGFVLTGFTSSFGTAGSEDVWVVRTDDMGIASWNRTYGGAQDDACWSIAECSAGGFILGGTTKSQGAGDMDFLLVRTNETGEQVWNQTWGGPLEDWGVCALECKAGGFALAGSTYSFGAGNRDGWLIRTDANGQQLWNRTYGGPVKDSINAVIECSSGGFALAGDTYTYGAGGSDMWLVRTGADGVEAWNEAAGGGLNDYGRAVAEGRDGRLTVAGIAYSFGAGAWDAYVACYGSPNWTILVYMDADNDLEQYAFDDINSMELVGSTDRMNVIVLVDFWNGAHAPYTGAKCYNITHDVNQSVIGSLELASPLPSEPDMADWQTLQDFIVFGQTYAPADRYVLVVWDHGEGFYGVCLDDTSGDAMGIDELARALSGAVERLDIVAFDACMMAQLEVAYEVRNCADVLVFSEAGIPLTGFPYEDILASMNTTSPATGEQAADLIVNTYTWAYGPGGRYSSQHRTDLCLSAVHTSSLDAVVAALDDLASTLMQSWFLDTYFDDLCLVRAATQSFDRPDFMDLGNFANNTVDWICQSQAQAKAEALGSQLYFAVFTESHLAGLPGATGLALSFADTVRRYSYLLNLTIAGCHWYNFMSAFTFVGLSTGSAHEAGYSTRFGYLDGPNDRFYFVVTPAVSGYYRIDMGHLWEGYDDDFDLYLLSDSLHTLDSSTSAHSYEAVEAFLSEGSTYYIMVKSFNGDSVRYGLGVFDVTVSLRWVTTGSTYWVFTVLAGLAGAAGLLLFVLAAIYAAVRHDRTRAASRSAYLGSSPSPRGETRIPDAARLPPGQVLFCPYCGAPLAQGDVFCYSCGSRIPSH
jgi:hypothetical protein